MVAGLNLPNFINLPMPPIARRRISSHITAATTRLLDVQWHPAYRIIPSRFPSINIFDRVASRDDFDLLYQLEAMTNPRIRDEVGDLTLVPHDQRKFGPGNGAIMAAFTHLNPLGSRFSDGSYGVFYAALEQRTAVAETRYHCGNFMRATNEKPQQLQMRVYHVEIAGKVHDASRVREDDPIVAPDSWLASRAYAAQLREQGSNGIHYRSVRQPDGLCVAAFCTGILSNCRHASQLLYQWDGKEIADVYEKLVS